MKLRDMFVSEEQLTIDSLIREAIEEKWLREAREESAEEPEEERPSSKGDDFGDEPDEFVDKDTSYLEDEESEEEFRGAPADPMLAPSEPDFGDEPDASTFSDDPVFGEIPEPSADPESPLWHSAADLDDASSSSVSFPDYEGPTHRDSDHPDDKPDEQGFYPRPKTSKKSRR